MRFTYLMAAFLSLATATALQAKTYKLGTMVPDGTKYSAKLKEMAKKIKKDTDGKVKLKFIWGGVAGDERDVVNKIRVGQFHGGLFTAKTLGEIFGDVRLMEVPFSFKDRAHSQKVLAEFMPHFSQGLKAKGFENLGIYETGEIYLVSKNKIENVAGLKDQKLWLYNGDSLAEAFIKSMGLVAVPVTLPDVLSSLSTGLINTAYAPAIGIVALQWHSKVSYLMEPAFGYHFQGLLLSNKAFKRIKPEHQKIVKKYTEEYAKLISDINFQEAGAALSAIKSQGVKVVKWPDSDLKQLKDIRSKVINELSGKVLSKDVVNKFNGMM
ncbi:MAG: TRAP transporter substrate-binding protein DctP [Pseudobacteriovorax sp.]|nr:TRAP transporter substrate-binding protein DctP [Pseudobacteriovorax sp.]